MLKNCIIILFLLLAALLSQAANDCEHPIPDAQMRRPAYNQLKNLQTLFAQAYNRGATDSAATLARQALAIAHPLLDASFYFSFTYNLAEILKNAGYTLQAITYYKAASRSANSRLMRGQAFSRLGAAFFEAEKYDSCLIYSRNSLALTEGLQDQLDGWNYWQIGAVLNRKGARTEGLMYLTQAYEISLKADPKNTSVIMMHIAHTYEGLGNPTAGIDWLQRALDNHGHSLNQRADLAKELMHLLMRNDMGKQALPIALRYFATSDSVNKQKQSQNIALMAASVETERGLVENHRLAAANAKDEAQIRLLIAIVVGVVAFAAVLAVVAIAMRRKKDFIKEQHEVALQQQQALEVQKHYLEEVNQSKDILLSVISHDVRGPVRSLGAVLDLALGGHLDADEQKLLMGNLRQEVTHTNRLLEDVLVWAKDQMGGINTHLTAVNVYDLLQELKEAFRLQALQLGVEISCEADSELLLARADEGLLRVVLRNLVSNALRVSVAPAQIRLSSNLAGDEVCLTVQDEGPGIPPEKMEILLGKDRHIMRNRNDAASGFGFVLVRTFTQRQGGRIEVETGPKGSRISIYFEAMGTVVRQPKEEQLAGSY